MDFSTIAITSTTVRGSHVNFSTGEITSKKIHGSHVDFSTSEVTSKRVRGNHADFSTIEIKSKKVRGNHVDFSTIEITSKKYVEMTWKFVEIWSSTYRRWVEVSFFHYIFKNLITTIFNEHLSVDASESCES